MFRPLRDHHQEVCTSSAKIEFYEFRDHVTIHSPKFKEIGTTPTTQGQLIHLPIESSFTSLLKRKQVSYLLLRRSIECLPLRGHDKNLKCC
jgi:hypothetical protein